MVCEIENRPVIKCKHDLHRKLQPNSNTHTPNQI